MTTYNVLLAIKQQKKVAALLVATMVMWAVGLPFLLSTAKAADVVDFSDTLSDSDVGVVSNHEIDFTMSSTGSLSAGTGDFTITFESDFSLPSALDTADFDLLVNGAQQNLDGTATNWTVSVSTSTRTVTFAAGSGVSLSSNDVVKVLVGTNATSTVDGTGPGVDQITNATSEGSYFIQLGGNMTDSGETRVAIIDDVTMSASVDTTFSFNIFGVATNTAPYSDDTATTTASTTATSIPFGTLDPGIAKLASQRLTVSTNAANGFSVTVQQDGEMESSSSANINNFVDGDATSTPQAWTSPSAIAGNPDTYGHYGISSDDSTLSSGDFFGAANYVGQFSSSTPLEIMYHNGVVNGSGDGETYVGVQIEISSLQEAATDYSNTLTYIATPVF